MRKISTLLTILALSMFATDAFAQRGGGVAAVEGEVHVVVEVEASRWVSRVAEVDSASREAAEALRWAAA